jgi:tripartite-type tricarboxylate transporter receptor subunit TctC
MAGMFLLPGFGYTLCLGGAGTHVINGAVLDLSYDVLKDLQPVSPIASAQLLIVARKSMPADDLKGLIAWLRDNPGKATQGTGGPGSLTNLVGLAFRKETGTQFISVPYRGSGAAINDLVAGRIDIIIDLAPNSLPHVHAGAIKAYAVMAKTRLPAAPAIPTVDEAELPGVYMSAWMALWAPKSTPKSIVARLNAAVVEALADPGLRARLAELGEDIFPREEQTPEALEALQRAEIDRWWPMLKAANLKAQ